MLYGIAGAASAILMLIAPIATLSTEVLTPLERQGKALLAKFCSDCHAIGRTGASANPAAPAFHTIDRRYPIDTLKQALEEKLLFSGAPEMPSFRFRRADICGGDRISAIDPTGLNAKEAARSTVIGHGPDPAWRAPPDRSRAHRRG
jgi:cytochrome c